jgi:hypothetical protein
MLHFLHPWVVKAGRQGKEEYALLALAIIVGIQLLGCVASTRSHATRLFEASSGISVAGACLFTLLIRGTYFPRQFISTLLVCAWGIRLSRFLYARNKKIERHNILARICWSLLCALPVVIANTKQMEMYRATLIEMFWIVTAAVAIGLEDAADVQKLRWHAHYADIQRPGKSEQVAPVCTDGLWAYCRHPNLFFECLFWWSVFFLVLPTTNTERYLIICPILLTCGILVLPGGIMTQETQRNKDYEFYPSYQHYKKTTPVFFPMKAVHNIMMQIAPHAAETLCLELTMYNTL